MSQVPGATLRILVVQPWIVPVDGIRTRLRAAGFAPSITRVDFEPALEAALSRGEIDLILVAPNTPALSMSFVEGRVRAHASSAPILELCDLERLPNEVRRVLTALMN